MDLGSEDQVEPRYGLAFQFRLWLVGQRGCKRFEVHLHCVGRVQDGEEVAVIPPQRQWVLHGIGKKVDMLLRFYLRDTGKGVDRRQTGRGKDMIVIVVMVDTVLERVGVFLIKLR